MNGFADMTKKEFGSRLIGRLRPRRKWLCHTLLCDP
jgi:hypothetical protein